MATMEAINIQPYRNFNFSVAIDGIEGVTGFSEVSGFDATFDVIEYREGNMVMTPMKVPGLMKYGNITLKKGASNNTALYDWLMESFDSGNVTLRDIVVTLYQQGSDKVAAQWQVINAWPVKYAAPDFNASGSEIAYETIELAHEGMTRLTGSGEDGVKEAGPLKGSGSTFYA